VKYVTEGQLKQQKLPEGLLYAFENQGLKKQDILRVAEVLQFLIQRLDQTDCWDLLSIKNKLNFEGVDSLQTTHHSVPFYKGRDVRPLLLAVAGEYKTPANSTVIKSARCKCKYCINPNHYSYGDNIDARIEKWRRRGHRIDRTTYFRLLKYREDDPKTYTYKKLAHTFNLKEHLVRAICISNEDF